MSRPRKRKPSSRERDELVDGPPDDAAGETTPAELSPDDEQVLRAVDEAADAILARVLADVDDDDGEPEPAEHDDPGLDERDDEELAPDDGATEEQASDAPPGEAPSDDAGEPPASPLDLDSLGREAVDTEALEEDGTLPGEDTEERPGLEKAPPVSVSSEHLKGVIESLLFVSDKPLSALRLARIAQSSTKEVHRLLDVLIEEYRGRGIELVEVAGGFQFRSAAANAPFVRELVARKPVRLTRAQIETLAMIAYRQPITRPEVDEIRGVDSGSALKVLAERNLVKIIGRKDEPGRPLLYGTTPHFLEFFGLASLSDLPTLREYSELNDESRALFQRRTGEAIEGIADISVEKREYSEEELEEASAELDREVETRAAEQLELGAAADDDEPAERGADDTFSRGEMSSDDGAAEAEGSSDDESDEDDDASDEHEDSDDDESDEDESDDEDEDSDDDEEDEDSDDDEDEDSDDDDDESDEEDEDEDEDDDD